MKINLNSHITVVDDHTTLHDLIVAQAHELNEGTYLFVSVNSFLIRGDPKGIEVKEGDCIKIFPEITGG